MISRKITPHLLGAAQSMPVVGLLGPRQSGKTTLARALFPHHVYISLEELDARKFAEADPRAFLESIYNAVGVIIDEFQYVPGLLSYIQATVDREKRNGYFILTGSQNFLAHQAISQSLAGRIAILTLMPLSIDELKEANLLVDKIEDAMFMGCYPRIFDQNLRPTFWYKNYIKTYVERDVRALISIPDLTLFQTFIQLIAGRLGQIMNIESLANDCGITVKMVHSWLSILEASYIIFRVQPYFRNMGKRLVKNPKIYFYDTGLACTLLGIDSAPQLYMHYLRGGLVESYMLAEIFKYYHNNDRTAHVYFWRDEEGHEIDCLLEERLMQIPIEIKAGKTIATDYFKELSYWNELTNGDPKKSFLIYAGTERQIRSQAQVLGWQSVTDLFSLLEKGEQ